MNDKNFFTSFLSLLSAVSLLNKNSSDDRVKKVSDILNFIISLNDEKTLTVHKLQQVTNTIKAMVQEDREPTLEEWKELFKRSDDAHKVIQNA